MRVMSRRPIDAGIDAGGPDEPPPEGVSADAFREAMSRWAAGVTVVAVRDAGTVHATTVSSFGSVSADPPLTVISLGANAQVLPFLQEGRRFVVNVLAESQRRLASVFADSFPVGPSPFPEDGDPVIPDALARIVCSVQRVVPAASSRLVLGLVVEAHEGPEGRPLLYWRRDYRELSPDS